MPCTREASAQVGWGEMGLCRKVAEEKVQAHKYSEGPKIPKFSVARKTAAIKHVEKLCVSLVDLRGFRRFPPAGFLLEVRMPESTAEQVAAMLNSLLR